jgi:hypothetical protein
MEGNNMKLMTLILAAGLALPAAAFAQTPPPAGGMSGPGGAMAGPGGGRFAACRDDAAKYCADKQRGERRACLNDNKDKVSDACKSALAAAPPPGN